MDMKGEFDCKRCGHPFKTKQNLQSHLKKKHICDPVLANIPVSVLYDATLPIYNAKTYDCMHCGKPHNDSSNKYKHQQKCDKNPDVASTTIADYERRIHELESKLYNQTSSASIASTASQSIVINNTVINNISYINDIRYPYVDHLESKFIEKCINGRDEGMGKLMDAIYFNPSVPENQVIRLRSLNNRLVEVHEEMNWIIRPFNESVSKMIVKIQNVGMRFFIENELTWNDNQCEDIQKYLIDMSTQKEPYVSFLKKHALASLEQSRIISSKK